MSTNNDIELLSTCTNLSIIDKINEIINKLNTPEAFVVEATELQKHIIASGTNPNYKCKLTIITENKSILIFSIICNPATKAINPIFVESVTNEFSNLGTFLYFGETSNDLILKYNKKCTVLIDGAIGDYTEFNPNTTGAENYIVDTKPADWGFYVPNEVVKAPGDNGEWLTLNKTYNNDGMKYQFIIGVNKSAIMTVVNNLRDELIALINAINEEIGDRDDQKSGGISFENLGTVSNGIYAVQVTNGDDTYVFGTRSEIFYCDGYVYLGDNYDSYPDYGGAVWSAFKTAYPDTYVNKDTTSYQDPRNFYKLQFDKSELESILDDINISSESNLRLNEIESESQLISIHGATPVVTEIQPASEGKDTIWANINDLYNRDQSTQNQISTINNDISGINTSLTDITQDISNLSSTVSDHSDAISELQSDVQTLDTALEGAIDKNTEQDGRLDNLESRMDDAEDRLDGIDTDLTNLKAKLAYTVEIDHTKEYTCIASIKTNLDENNNIIPFSVEYDVITDKNDELQFIVTDTTIKLINLTNQSYTSFNTNNELLISEKITGDTVKYNIYLKRYDSTNDTQVSVALINFIDCDIISYFSSSKDRTDFTTNYSALDCDTDFLRNIDPVIKYGTDIQNFSDGMDRVGDQNSKYGRVIKIPQPTSMHTLTIHDKSKSSSTSGYETQFNGSQDKTVDALSKVNTTQGGGLSGDGTNGDPLKVDSVDTQFDSNQFDITPGQTANDPTVISIKSSILNGNTELIQFNISSSAAQPDVYSAIAAAYAANKLPILYCNISNGILYWVPIYNGALGYSFSCISNEGSVKKVSINPTTKVIESGDYGANIVTQETNQGSTVESRVEKLAIDMDFLTVIGNNTELGLLVPVPNSPQTQKKLICGVGSDTAQWEDDVPEIKYEATVTGSSGNYTVTITSGTNPGTMVDQIVNGAKLSLHVMSTSVPEVNGKIFYVEGYQEYQDDPRLYPWVRFRYDVQTGGGYIIYGWHAPTSTPVNWSFSHNEFLQIVAMDSFPSTVDLGKLYVI